MKKEEMDFEDATKFIKYEVRPVLLSHLFRKNQQHLR